MSGGQQLRPHSLGSLVHRSVVGTEAVTGRYGRPESPKSDACVRKWLVSIRTPNLQPFVNNVMKHTWSAAQKTGQENFIWVSLRGFCPVGGHRWPSGYWCPGAA